MGIHFDALVNIGTQNSPKRGLLPSDTIVASMFNNTPIPMKTYLNRVLNQAALFDITLKAEDIKEKFEAEQEELASLDKEGTPKNYNDYLKEYHHFSTNYDKFMLMPYNVTAIEDESSVVLLEEVVHGAYRTVVCEKHSKSNISLYSGVTFMSIEDGQLKYQGMPDFYFGLGKKAVARGLDEIPPVPIKNPFTHAVEKYISPEEATSRSLGTAAKAFYEQCCYIIDPANFVLEEQPKSYLKTKAVRESERLRGQRPRPLKTQKRPKYRPFTKDGIVAYQKQVAPKSEEFVPVIGYYRTFHSDKFKNMQGKTIWVNQHHRGDIKFATEDQKKHYSVHVKGDDFKETGSLQSLQSL